MARKIKSTDIVEDGLFDSTIKGAKELLKVINSLEKSFIKNIEAQKKYLEESKATDFKKYKEQERSIEGIKNETEKLNNIQKQKKIIEEQILDLYRKENVESEKLKISYNNQKRAIRENIALENTQIGSLSRLRLETKKLIKERDNLNLNTERGKKRLVEINNEINKNNEKIKENVSALEKQKQNVGNYTASIQEAINNTGIFGNAISNISNLTNIYKQQLAVTKAEIAATTEVMKGAELSTIRFSKAIKIAGLALKLSGITLLLTTLGGLVGFFTQFEEGKDTLEAFGEAFQIFVKDFLRRLSILTNGWVAYFEKIGKKIQIFFLELDNFFGKNNEKISLLKSEIESLEETINKSAGAWDGFGTALADSLEKGNKIVDLRDDVAKLTRILSLEIEDLSTNEAIYQQLVNDGTLSFKARKEALEKLQDVEVKIREKQLALAKKQLNAEIEIESFKTGASVDAIKKALDSQDAQGAILESTLENLTKLKLEVIKIEGDIQLQRENRRANQRDIEQKELINRISVLRDYDKVEEVILKNKLKKTGDNYAKQIEILSDFNKKSFESFSNQVDLLRPKAEQFIDVFGLLAIESATELENQIQSLGLSDKLSKLLVDVIMDRKKAMDDINSMIEDINDKYLTNLKKTQEAFKRGVLSDEDFKLRQDYLKKLKEEEEKRRKFLEDTEKAITDALERELIRREELRERQLDREINERQRAVDLQQGLAERGLQNTLAFEKQKLAEAELEQQRLEERRLKREKTLVYWRAISSYLNSGETGGSSLAKALVDVLTAETIAAFFYEGTENVENSLKGRGKAHNGRDGYRGLTRSGKLIAFDGNERILNPSQNKMIGNISNQELTMLAYNYRKSAEKTDQVKENASYSMLLELKKLNERLENKRELNVSWNSLDERVESTVEYGMKRVVRFIRKKPRI